MKTKWFFTLLMIAALLRGALPVGKVSASNTPESNVWTNIGPEGGNISALAIDPVTPTTLYAGTTDSMFKSTDGGGNWSTINTGLTDTFVIALAIDPNTPTILYAGTGDGVYKSMDGGGNWSAVNTGLPTTITFIRALAIDPKTPTTLYAAVYGGMFKSTDGGGHWNAASTGLGDTDVRTLAINPATPTTLYAGTWDGVFRSTDGGGHWSAINTGLTSTDVLALAIDPKTSTTLYTGTGSGGVFKSTNGGENWSAVNIGLTTDTVFTVAIDPKTPTTLYVGTNGSHVFKSTNSGGNWSAVNSGLPNISITCVYALVIDPATPTTLYAGILNSGGVFKSTDSGGNWSAINAGLTVINVEALAIDPATPTTLYAGVYGSLFKSTDGGGNWSAVNASLDVRSLAIDPATPATLYAGAGNGGGGVHKSTDSGGNWSAVNTGLTNTLVSTLAIDPKTPTTLYAGTYGDGVYKSTNGGGNWSAVNTGLPVNTSLFGPYYDVDTLAINPATPTTLYAGTENGVYKSTDGGGNWSAVNTGLTVIKVEVLAIDPKTPTTLYAGTYGGGVFKSTNGGGNWSAVNTGLTGDTVYALVIDPATPTTLYAGIPDNGVFKSTDGGGNWSEFNTGLTNFSVSTLAIDPATPTTLYAGTHGGSIIFGYNLALVTAAPYAGTYYGGVFKSTNGTTSLTGAVISGPTTGTINTAHTFTATISPITATTPITYTWTPAPNIGQGTANAIYTWVTAGAKTITVTAQNSINIVADTHGIIINTAPDAYEPDDTCTQAKAISTNGAAQAHTFHQYADADWLWFDVISSTTYILQTANPQINADTTLELRPSCPQPPLGTDDNVFGREARITWRATFTGRVYAKAGNHSASVYGADTGYDLSVRTYTQPPVVVIVGGHDNGYTLQPNIDYASDLAYRTFLNSGVPKANLRYFSPNPNRDVDSNGLNDDIFAAATITNVRDAVQDWSRIRGVSLGVPFYLYLADHGYYDQFLAAGSNGRVFAEQLNLWLSNLEATSGTDNINVILEACKSGSFIDVTTLGPNQISGRNRVVIASTSSVLDAYPSVQGAYFSDVFWMAVGQSQDLKTAFETAKQAVQATGLSQQPWLDDNGDSVADAQDGMLARGRGLGLSFGNHAPAIDWVQVGGIAGKTGTVQAQIRDDFGVDKAWVVVYPPGFVAPPPSSSPATPVLNVPTRTLSLAGTDLFTTAFNGFTQTGWYRVVAYAQDAEQQQAVPQSKQVCLGCSTVYLPLVRQ